MIVTNKLIVLLCTYSFKCNFSQCDSLRFALIIYIAWFIYIKSY